MELNEKMLKEIFNALEKGETFNYSDDNTTFSISPNGISIQYQNNITTKKVEVEKLVSKSILTGMLAHSCYLFSTFKFSPSILT